MIYQTFEPSNSSQIVYHQAHRVTDGLFAEGGPGDPTVYLGMVYVRIVSDII